MYRLKPVEGIPPEILKAIELYSFGSKPGRYGVTTLLQPVQATILKRRYPEEVKEDPQDQLWRLFGSAFHKLLEEGAEALGIDSRRSEDYISLEIFERWVGGVIDLHVDDESITDYKLTKAWSVIKQDRIDEWVLQLNMYRYMVWRQTGVEIKKLRIAAFFRDWEKKFTLQNSDYPKAKMQLYELPLLDFQEVENFMERRIAKLIMAEWMPDELLPPCSKEEMWEKPTEFAVYKETKKKGEWVSAKRASRVLESEELAQAYIDNAALKPSERYSIDVRPGRRIKCEGVFDGGETYCPIAHICPQHQAYLAEKARKGDTSGKTS
jgi:hypothetical protein